MAHDLTGERFAALTVVEKLQSERKPNGRMVNMYRCRCDCGGERVTSGRNLKAGDVKSCGCLRGCALTGLKEMYATEFTPKRFVGIRDAFATLEECYYGQHRITVQSIKGLIVTRYKVISDRTHKMSGAWEDTAETA
jgi:hypothetical protein